MKILKGWQLETRTKLDLFKEYLRKETPLSDTSIQTYSNVLHNFFGQFKGSEDVGDFNRFLKKHPRQPVRSALKYYIRSRGLGIKLIKVREPRPKERIIPTIEEFIKVIELLPKEEKNIALFLLHTGARAHEAMKLKVGDFQYDGTIQFKTKGGQSRLIRVPPGYEKTLFNWVNSRNLFASEYVFYTDRKSTINSKVIWFWIQLNATAKVHLNKTIQTHDFRRYYATYLRFIAGYEVEVIQKLMGHSNIRTTLRYTSYGVTPEMINKAAMDLDNIYKTIKPDH